MGPFPSSLSLPSSPWVSLIVASFIGPAPAQPQVQLVFKIQKVLLYVWPQQKILLKVSGPEVLARDGGPGGAVSRRLWSALYGWARAGWCSRMVSVGSPR